MSESLYVDIEVTSVGDEDDLKKCIHDTKFLFETSKFDLQNILSAKIENSIPAEKRISPVLGLKWNLNEDLLSIGLRECDLKIEILTKKKKSLNHRVLDLCGYTSPGILRPKIMLQECWK